MRFDAVNYNNFDATLLDRHKFLKNYFFTARIDYFYYFLLSNSNTCETLN